MPSPHSTSRPLRLPGQRGALSHLHRKVQGRCLPFFVEQFPAPRHRKSLPWVWWSRPGVKGTPLLCLWRVEPPLQSVNPACDCQDRCELPSPCRARTRGLTRELHLLCKPGQQHNQEENLSSLTPLLQDTLRDGGQTGQVGGHIGRCGETGGGASVTCDTRKGESWWPWKLAEL